LLVFLFKERIKKILDAKSQNAYIDWYILNKIYHKTKWRGVNAQKFPPDMWNYQEIIMERNVSLVIEFGARYGGSTLFFSDLVDHVLSIDFEDQWDPKCDKPNITKIVASTISDEAINAVKLHIQKTSGSVFAILDSAHDMTHVHNELRRLTPLLRKGDYVIVEDSYNQNFDGPLEAIKKYTKENPNQYKHDYEREKKFGCTFSQLGYLIKN